MKLFGVELSRERVVWVVVTLALIVSALVLLSRNMEYGRQLAKAKLQESALNKEIEDARRLLEEKQRLLLLEQGPGQDFHDLSDWDIKRLKEKGLEDPINDLVNDLMRHSQLIPYDGVLGGQMGFYYRREIHVLGPKWVFAYFDDGHISGQMLLEYQVSDGGKISWRVIESYVD